MGLTLWAGSHWLTMNVSPSDTGPPAPPPLAPADVLRLVDAPDDVQAATKVKSTPSASAMATRLDLMLTPMSIYRRTGECR
jgi:hypothetical protein